MKRIITSILLLLTANIVYSYDFQLDLRTNSVKDYTCVLQYDDTQKNLSFDKGFSQELIKKEVNDNISLVCSVPITIIKLNLYNDNRELIYTEQVVNKKSYQYQNHISTVELEIEEDNMCNIKTDSKVEEYELNKGTDLDLDFIKVFSISCNSSLEGSTLRLYDDTSYNLKYKVFEENQKSFTIDLDKPIINYKNKVELYLRPYDRKDNFKCTTSNNGDKVEFTNTEKILMLYKTFYSINNFKLDCDYKFKQVQLFAIDSYFNKDISEFEYYNVSTINTQLNITIKKVIEKVVEKVKIDTPKPVIKTNVVNITKEVIKVTPYVFQGPTRPTTDIEVFRNTGEAVNILKEIFARHDQTFTLNRSAEAKKGDFAGFRTLEKEGFSNKQITQLAFTAEQARLGKRSNLSTSKFFANLSKTRAVDSQSQIIAFKLKANQFIKSQGGQALTFNKTISEFDNILKEIFARHDQTFTLNPSAESNAREYYEEIKNK